MSRSSFLILCIYAFAMGCGTGKPTGPGASPEEPISQGNFFGAYEFNEAAADARFLNKSVTIAVLVSKIGKSQDGRYYVGAHKWSAVPGGEPNLLCFWEESKATEIASLKPGSKISVTGVCKGKSADSSRNPPYRIALEKCSFRSYSDEEWQALMQKDVKPTK